MHLYFIRHGQSFVNLPDYDGLDWDRELTPLGHRQAEKLAQWLPRHINVDALYTSTMLRARETAAYISQAVDVQAQPDDRIREIGTCWSDASPVANTSPRVTHDFWASAQPFMPLFDNGESWLDFLKRVGWFISDITACHQESDDRVLVVCHGGVINAMIDIAFNVGMARHAEVWNHNTGITHWEYKPSSANYEDWRLHGVNLAYHLMEDEALAPL